MDTTLSTEAAFKQFNGQRLTMLRTLLTDAQRATELCDAWLASGHIADFRAWQTRVRNIDIAEEAYRKLGENA